MLKTIFEVVKVGGCQQKPYTYPLDVTFRLDIVSLTGKFFVVVGLFLFLFCREVVPTEGKPANDDQYAQSQNYDGDYIHDIGDRNRQQKTNHDDQSTNAFSKSNLNPIPPTSTMDPCSYDIMDDCFRKIPKLPENGIPSSSAEVEVTCKAFDIGMKCMRSWSKMCLNPEAQEKMQKSVQGAFEVFAFLCGDPRFRKEYLKHGGCYRKITQLWEECENNFIESIKRSDHHSADSRKICCVRIRFLQCVTELSHLQCGKEPADFLQLLAENLVRETMGNANKDNSNSKSGRLQCDTFTYRNCSSWDKRNGGVGAFSLWPSVSNKILILYLIVISIFPTASLFL